MEMSDRRHAPATLLPENTPFTHGIGGWVRPRDILDILEKRNIYFCWRASNPGSFSHSLNNTPATPFRLISSSSEHYIHKPRTPHTAVTIILIVSFRRAQVPDNHSTRAQATNLMQVYWRLASVWIKQPHDRFLTIETVRTDVRSTSSSKLCWYQNVWISVHHVLTHFTSLEFLRFIIMHLPVWRERDGVICDRAPSPKRTSILPFQLDGQQARIH
jgi:hypothetical protein